MMTDILEKTLGKARKPQVKEINIGTEDEPVMVEMHKPTLKQKKELYHRADKVKVPTIDEFGRETHEYINDLDSLSIHGIIELTYKPGGKDKVFDTGHYDEFFQFSADEPWILKLTEAFITFAWSTPSGEEKEEKKSNSQKTSKGDS